jgi:hypothetical protein
VRTFYYGCWQRAGHYLWHRANDGTPMKMYDQGASDRRLLGITRNSLGGPTQGEIPWGYCLDGGILKGTSGKQGEAIVDHRDGWTALSFWDSSVDSRPGSCSTFVFDERLEPADALRLARELWTPIFDRFGFEVALA